MQNWERSGLFDIRKPDPQAENLRFRAGTGPKTEGAQFSIQDGLPTLRSILSLPSHARQVSITVFFWIPVLLIITTLKAYIQK